VRVGRETLFENLPLDRYDIYLEHTPNVHERVSLDRGGELIEVRLAVPEQSTSIEGVVVDENGVGIPDAWVTASCADTAFEDKQAIGSPALTDAEGVFALNDLSPGSFDVTATSPAGEAVLRRVRGGEHGVEL